MGRATIPHDIGDVLFPVLFTNPPNCSRKLWSCWVPSGQPCTMLKLDDQGWKVRLYTHWHASKDVFTSYAEAQKEADRRNTENHESYWPTKEEP